MKLAQIFLVGSCLLGPQFQGMPQLLLPPSWHTNMPNTNVLGGRVGQILCDSREHEDASNISIVLVFLCFMALLQPLTANMGVGAHAP